MAGDAGSPVGSLPGGDGPGGRQSRPRFLGANPATVTDNEGRTISRPLGPEQDVAQAFLASLDGEQRDRAVIDAEAPPDILTGNTAEVDGQRSSSWPEGLPGQALRPDQLSRLRSLAAVYINRLAAPLADPRLARLDRDLRALCFAWAGSTDPAAGQPHYYRLDGPRLFVEFDNRQNAANHIHSVWRDPEGDFGARLL